MSKVRGVEDGKIKKEVKKEINQKINKGSEKRNWVNKLGVSSAGVNKLTSTSKTLSKNNSENSFSNRSARPTYSISNRLLASLLLGALFLNTSQPVKLAKAETLPPDYEFKAPQTINTNPEEVKDFEGYDNDLDYQVIPEDNTLTRNRDEIKELIPNHSSVHTSNPSLSLHQPPTIDTTLPVAISNLMKSYQQRILLAMGDEKDRSTVLKNILNKVYPTIRETIQNAYASAAEPWKSGTSNTVVALFNNTNYLVLRRQAEDKKRKDKEKAKSKLIDGNKKLKDDLVNILKNIKDKFRKQKLATLKRLENLKKSQEQNISNLTKKLKNVPNRLIELKRALANKLNSFNYFKSKETEERREYIKEDKESKHCKKKYKKYKKKYKKKHKSKYKKRYRKYKKKYKKHKKRRDDHKRAYHSYKNQKNQAYQEYLKLQREISSLGNNQTVLKQQLSLATTELDRTKEELENETSKMSKAWPLESSDSGAKGQAFSEAIDKDYQTEINQALSNFEISQQKLKDDFVNDLQKTEDEYQSNLNKAEIYKSKIKNINQGKQSISLTKSEQKKVWQDIQKKYAQDNYVHQANLNFPEKTNSYLTKLKTLQRELLNTEKEKTALENNLSNTLANSSGAVTSSIAITKSVPYTIYETVVNWVSKTVIKYKKVKKTIKEKLYRMVKRYKTIYETKKERLLTM